MFHENRVTIEMDVKTCQFDGERGYKHFVHQAVMENLHFYEKSESGYLYIF